VIVKDVHHDPCLTMTPSKKYTKKTRQAVASSLDPLGLPRLSHMLSSAKNWSGAPPPHEEEGDGVCVQYERRQVMIGATAAFGPNGSNWGGRGGCLRLLSISVLCMTPFFCILVWTVSPHVARAKRFIMYEWQ
jgi:hypothetical protein